MDTTSSRTSTEKPSSPLPALRAEAGSTGRLMDVWSRSGDKYRNRAVFLLVVNVVLFAGVGMFAYWIRSGVVFAPTMDGYADQLGLTFSFLGKSGVSLGSMLLAPISVQDVPMQIPILGLLMAALIAIPILVAILYRFWASLPFIAIVAFLAVMPWLSITLLGSCVLASVRPLRTRFRFMSALLGLVPAVVYLVLASSGTAELVAGKIDPIDNIKFVAPWVFAVVSSTVLFAIVLTIAALVKYRPGAIAPLLAVMFILPMALFEFRVGRDELHYRLLSSLNEAYFEEVDASAELRWAAQRAWDRHPLPRPRWEEVYEYEEEKWQMALAADLDPVRSELARHQEALVTRCDRFRRAFPRSPYVLDVLFMKARALDMRVDAAEFRRTKWIRFYDDLPNSASQMTWRVIVENSPDSFFGAVALLRLAQFEARQGDLDRALDKLRTLLSRFGEKGFRGWDDSATRTAHVGTEPVVAGMSGTIDRAIWLERVALSAARLHSLCSSNRDPLYGYDPLCGATNRSNAPTWFGLLDLDTRHDGYVKNLEILKASYPHCRLEDNIDLEIAKVADSPGRRIELLEACLAAHPHGDAAPEALFALGVAYLDDGQPAAGDESFGRLAHEFPKSTWAVRALQSLEHTRLARASGVSQ